MESAARIILVDDIPEMETALTAALEARGFTVDPFTSSSLALSSFKADKYDIALLDIVIPEMDGLDLAWKLLTIDPKIVILFLTAYGEVFEAEYKSMFPSFGLERYMRKPVTSAALTVTIRKALQKEH
jgi:DNA-binding response OmpR family regulator